MTPRPAPTRHSGFHLAQRSVTFTPLPVKAEALVGFPISPHFHKPVASFIGDMMYGIMAEKDVKFSSIVRALKERITPKKLMILQLSLMSPSAPNLIPSYIPH
jgi:hypothetical protein